MTEEQIIAYVDGELGPIDALRCARAAEADPALAARIDRHRTLRARIEDHFAPIADEAPPARLTGLFDRRSNIVTFRAKPRWSGQRGRYAALAATLVAGLVAGRMLPHPGSAPVAERGGAIIASGELGRALDNQLASAAPADPVYRIGVSFRAGDGRYCRTFTGARGAGLGCRGSDGWTLDRYVGGPMRADGSAYRQAGSPSAEILAAAQGMMTGEPLDAAGEAAAVARGWKDQGSNIHSPEE